MRRPEIVTVDALPDGAKELWFAPGYFVTSGGAVYSARGMCGAPLVKLKNHTDRAGYLYTKIFVNGHPRQMFIHQLVLRAFVGECPDGCETRHFDGDRSNPRLSNLAWGTKRENADDKIKHFAMRKAAAVSK